MKLNHATSRAIQDTARSDTFLGLPSALKRIPPPRTWTSCAHAQQRPRPRKPTLYTYRIGGYFSSDTCRPLTPTFTHGNNLFMTFFDAGSRFLIFRFLKYSREVGSILPKPLNIIYALGVLPHTSRTDNDLEYCSGYAKDLYSRTGINHVTTTPHQPQETLWLRE